MSDRIDTDAVLHKAMSANHLEDPGHEVDLEGGLYGPTKHKQRAERDLIYALVETGGQHIGKHVFFEGVAPKMVEALAQEPFLAVTLAMGTIGKAFKTIQEGDELNAAVKREYAMGACLVLCIDALPEGFRSDVGQGFVGKGNASHGAALVLTAIRARPDAAQIEEGMVANCRDGQLHALQRRITTADDLATALKQNREFAQRYEHDLAFKLGADSVIWAKAHSKLPEIEGQLPPPPAPLKMEVRG